MISISNTGTPSWITLNTSIAQIDIHTPVVNTSISYELAVEFTHPEWPAPVKKLFSITVIPCAISYCDE